MLTTAKVNFALTNVNPCKEAGLKIMFYFLEEYEASEGVN